MKSLPAEFEEIMRHQLPADFPLFLESLKGPAPVSIRTHPVKDSVATNKRAVPWSEFGAYLPTRPVFTLDPLFHAGSYYVQEASSMFLEQALRQTVDLKRNIKVLDLCAAPGGKSTNILSLLNRDSLLVSNETIRSRSNILSENIQKWGYPNSVVTSNDPADFAKLRGFFDVIVVDAPCSGEGLFRKEPEAIDEWSPENIRLCASRQKRIIADVWNALSENGIFIYCTCTYNALENEENLRWLEEKHAVEFLHIATEPSWDIEEVQNGNVIGYRFYPHRVNGEGFFLAAMRKTETVDSAPIKTNKSLAVPLAKIRERLYSWIQKPTESSFFQFNDLVFFSPSSIAGDFRLLLQSLKIVYAGTNVARIKHEKLIPEHALALSTEVNKENFARIEVSEEDALRYLRREQVQLNGSPGFALLTFRGLPLGWVNVLQNRLNNMYPSDWRIRMSTRL